MQGLGKDVPLLGFQGIRCRSDVVDSPGQQTGFLKLCAQLARCVA